MIARALEGGIQRVQFFFLGLVALLTSEFFDLLLLTFCMF